MASCSAAVKPSGVYGSSAGFSTVTTSFTCAAASFAARDAPTLAPRHQDRDRRP